MRNHWYWIHWSRRVFRKQIVVLRKVITERLMPTFSAIENEADAISDETWERLNANGDPDGDPGLDAQAAGDAGDTHYFDMVDAKQGLLNLFAVALHHLLEQQQLTVIRQELLPHGEDITIQLLKIAKFPTPQFVKRLNDSGIEIEAFANWGVLEELRHVANAVKHADGNSAEWLRTNCPEIFTHPLVRGQEQPSVQNPIRWPFQPLSGQDLYVTADAIERYFRAAEAFWLEFEDALASKAQVIT